MTPDTLHGLAAGFAHPLTGLDHMLAMFAVGVWAAQLGGRALWAVPATFVGAMALGGLLGFAGLHPPLMEPMIAASVLALGLLVAFAVQRKAPGVALIALFALFHGIAHALGIPHHDS
ncbi:MAG: HupE/UreJ family protein, partial [Burkholderiales bacterium]|nr:HupE/UreJ family protein [Burkholderiales bacterium]